MSCCLEPERCLEARPRPESCNRCFRLLVVVEAALYRGHGEVTQVIHEVNYAGSCIVSYDIYMDLFYVREATSRLI
jgi:hypothetical protein